MKNKFKDVKPLWSVFILMMLGLAIAIFVQESNITKSIDSCPRYTIASVTSIGHKSLDYRYTVMNKDFFGTWHQNPRSLKEYISSNFSVKNFSGKRFLVRINCKQPEINEIDWTRSVPEDVRLAPEEGWKAIPKSFPKTEFAD